MVNERMAEDPRLSSLLDELISLPKETEWVERKRNWSDPEDIGQYLSALSNSAALHRKEAGYILWGVDDNTGTFVGTSFKPKTEKVGSEELEDWLARLLQPRADFHIHEFSHRGRPAVLSEVQPAFHQPVAFRGARYIRIGSCRQNLKDHPEKERAGVFFLPCHLSALPFLHLDSAWHTERMG